MKKRVTGMFPASNKQASKTSEKQLSKIKICKNSTKITLNILEYLENICKLLIIDTENSSERYKIIVPTETIVDKNINTQTNIHV